MKKFFSLLLISFGICFAFVFNHSSSFAMGSAMTIDYAMWNAYNISAEYMCGRASRNLQNPDYSDITQISGINNPFSSSSQYGQILWNASGRTGTISQSDVWNTILSSAQELDVSSMSSEELSDFLDKVGVVQAQAGTNFIIKTSELNGIRFYWATNKAGEWLGSSFKNILAKFDTSSLELDSAIQSESSSLYPFSTLFVNNFYSYNFSNTDYVYQISLSQPCFIYCDTSQVNYVLCVIPHSSYSSFSFSASRFLKTTGDTVVSSYNHLDIFSTFTLNNVTYDICNFYCNFNGADVVTNNNSFSSLDDIKTQISSHGYLGETINSELIDSKSVPYTVPDIGDLATPITDVYPIISLVRDGVITVPTTGELATTIGDALKGEIAEAIADAIADAIAVPDVKEDDKPAPPDPVPDDPIELPDWIVPTFIPDLLPVDMFSMFQPVMDIVGTSNSIYGFWIALPTVLIFLFILYIIVSVL